MARAGALAGALVIAACGGSTADRVAVPAESTVPSQSETTETDSPAAAATSAVDPTVVDTAVVDTTVVEATPPPAVATTDAPPTSAADPRSFSQLVQPILEANCASCHTGDGPGAPHMAFDTAGQVAAGGDFVAAAVTSGYMPPWPAADGDVAFQHDRRLSADDIRAIVDWVDGGAKLDVDPSTPLTASRTVVEPIERDVAMTGEPYKGSLDDVDDYRCQVYDPQLTAQSFLQGMSFEPDQKRVVHHALLFRASASTRLNADSLSGADGKPGWSCPAIPNLRGGTVNQILSWAPGMAPTKYPADTGLAMEPGDFFIMQIHYHYSDETVGLPADASTIAVDFASDDVVKAAGGRLDPLALTLYLGPAEIPCSTDQSGPLCDRDAAIDALRNQNDPLSGLAANALLFGCGATVDDFASMVTGVASSTCTLPATPGQIVSVWGHEHEIGQSFKMTLNPGRPDEKVLLDIPRWDFNWQLDYAPVDKVVIEPGSTIRIDCTWDRSRSKIGQQPRYIFWSEGTESEMCYSQVITRPAE